MITKDNMHQALSDYVELSDQIQDLNNRIHELGLPVLPTGSVIGADADVTRLCKVLNHKAQEFTRRYFPNEMCFGRMSGDGTTCLETTVIDNSSYQNILIQVNTDGFVCMQRTHVCLLLASFCAMMGMKKNVFSRILWGNQCN